MLYIITAPIRGLSQLRQQLLLHRSSRFSRIQGSRLLDSLRNILSLYISLCKNLRCDYFTTGSLLSRRVYISLPWLVLFFLRRRLFAIALINLTNFVFTFFRLLSAFTPMVKKMAQNPKKTTRRVSRLEIYNLIRRTSPLSAIKATPIGAPRPLPRYDPLPPLRKNVDILLALRSSAPI